MQNNRVHRNVLNSWAKLVVSACARALHFEILCNFVTRAFGSWVVVENGYFGKLTGKHGDTLKDRVTEGTIKSKLRWGVGEGGKLMAVRQEYLFPILKCTHQCIFRARYRGRVNCGRELKRSVLCLALHVFPAISSCHWLYREKLNLIAFIRFKNSS